MSTGGSEGANYYVPNIIDGNYYCYTTVRSSMECVYNTITLSNATVFMTLHCGTTHTAVGYVIIITNLVHTYMHTYMYVDPTAYVIYFMLLHPPTISLEWYCIISVHLVVVFTLTCNSAVMLL